MEHQPFVLTALQGASSAVNTYIYIYVTAIDLQTHIMMLQARRYQQDVAALDQVFEYIMQSLANYR